MNHRWLAWILVWALAGCSDSREELMQELADPSPVKRAGALRVLAKETDEDAYRLLTRGLDDRSAVVRVAAVRSLAVFKGKDTTAALVRASRDADPEVRAAAVEALLGRGGEAAGKALMGMLLRGEQHAPIRIQIRQGLDKLGLQGEKLAEKMAGVQMEQIDEEWEKAPAPHRARLVTRAGRSVHPHGMQVVMHGLMDQDAEVVLAALGVLDGRGGKEVVRQLLLLASDRAVQVRLAAIPALASYGEEGLTIMKATLRDLHAEVRQLALAEMEKANLGLDTVEICPLLVDEDLEVALAAARIVRAQGTRCDLGFLADDLEEPDSRDCKAAVQVLTTLGTEPARKLLGRAMAKRPASLRPVLAAALVRAGEQRRELGRLIESELASRLDDLQRWSESWVRDKLPASQPGEAENAEDAADRKDKTRLTDEQIKKLYEKHGLPPAGEHSPRGIADLLAAFPDAGAGDAGNDLLVPVLPDDVELIVELLDGLLAFDPEKARPLVLRMLGTRRPELVGKAARLLIQRGVNLQPDENLMANLVDAIQVGRARDIEPIASLVALAGGDAATRLGGLLESAPFDKREVLIRKLSELGSSDSVPYLLNLLTGYSAGSVALALSEIGAKEAVEPLRKALEQAGPSIEMSLLTALARLGDHEIIPRLEEKLYDPDPQVRLAAVQILGKLGGSRAQEALRATRYDLDRIVRRETLKFLSERASGE